MIQETPNLVLAGPMDHLAAHSEVPDPWDSRPKSYHLKQGNYQKFNKQALVFKSPAP